MSNILIDTTYSTTTNTNDTITVTSNIISITDNLGNKILPKRDTTNSYIYWLFPIDDLSYNITTPKDINNLGFVISGDSNDYYSEGKIVKFSAEYYKFPIVVGVTNTGSEDLFRDNYNLIYTLDYVIIEKYNNDFNYCIKGTDEIERNKLVEPRKQIGNGIKSYSEYRPKKNIMDLTMTSFYPGATGGITKGNISVFSANKQIQVYRNITTLTESISMGSLDLFGGGAGAYTNDFSENQTSSILSYDSNIISSTSSLYYLYNDGSGNVAGKGTNINNSIITSTSYNGTNGLSNNQFYCYIDEMLVQMVAIQKSINRTEKLTGVELPSLNKFSCQYIFNIPSLTNSCQIPFNLDNTVKNFNMNFDINKNIIINGSGLSVTAFCSYNGFKNMYMYNGDFQPYLRKGEKTIRIHEKPYWMTIDTVISNYNRTAIKAVAEPTIEINPSYITSEDSNYGPNPMCVKASTNFALLYYQFTMPQINILLNVTKLIIDPNVIIDTIIINLPRNAPVNYVLTLQNDGNTRIQTNTIAYYKIVTTKAGTMTFTNNTKVVEKYVSLSSNITFTFKYSSNGNYWSMQ